MGEKGGGVSDWDSLATIRAACDIINLKLVDICIAHFPPSYILTFVSRFVVVLKFTFLGVCESLDIFLAYIYLLLKSDQL